MQGINPHVMVVAPCASSLHRNAPVKGGRVGGSQKVDLVVIIRRGNDTRVVVGPLNDRVIRIYHPPCGATIVGPPEDSLVITQLGELPIRIRFDESINTVRVVR